jgi:UDP-N-acetylmuramate-alanine ligase
VPVALVTGSNGKTTTTRLAAAMLRAAGHAVGTSSTDGVRVAGADVDAVLDEGDWAGPGGARLVLRDRRVTAAVLETARGGILRRGLAVGRAAAACVTNLAADHFGEYGVRTLDDLADAKLVVARALAATGGPLVVSADDATLRARAGRLAAAPHPVWWTVADETDAEAHALVAAHVAAGGHACRVRDARIEWHDGRAWADVAAVADVALAAGGRARHNVANAVTAVALASALGAPMAAVRDALHHFGAAPGDNPGRLEVVPVGDVTAVVDYAHNPAGLTALLGAAAALPARRRLLVLGQAGDRDDDAIADLARAAWAHGSVDRVQLKEVESMLRGRAPGDVPARLRTALDAAGAPPEVVAAGGVHRGRGDARGAHLGVRRRPARDAAARGPRGRGGMAAHPRRGGVARRRAAARPARRGHAGLRVDGTNGGPKRERGRREMISRRPRSRYGPPCGIMGRRSPRPGCAAAR